MLFKPTNLSPNNISVDVSKNIDFTWTVNGDCQTKYTFQIWDVATGTRVNATTNTTGIPKYTYNPTSNFLANGKQYKWNVQVFHNTASVTSDYVYFTSNITPVLTLTVPSTITSQSYTFEASYTQDDEIPYFKYKYYLYDNDLNLLKETEWIYDYAISCTMGGFISGKSYKIRCVAEGQYEVKADTGNISFNVSYTYPVNSNLLNVVPRDDIGAIFLTLSPQAKVTGQVIGNYSYGTPSIFYNYYLDLTDSDSKLIFYQTVPEKFTLTCWVYTPADWTSGDIMIIGDDDIKIGYNSVGYWYATYKTTDITLRSSPYALSEGWKKISVKYNKVWISYGTTNIMIG